MSSSTSIPQSSGHQQRPQNRSWASTSIPDFQAVLQSSKRVLALCGAGLSASSGLETFRGAGGMWRNYKASALATPEAFENDPGLVWLFYAYRRHKALNAKPNMGHYALAELARRKGEEGFMCLSQRANHPPTQLKLLHSSLFDLKCFSCPYIEKDNFSDPLHPSLLIDAASITARLSAASKTGSLSNSAPIIPIDELPHCPACKTGLLRPGVVWFDESLPKQTLTEINQWIGKGLIDLCLVIGTTAQVYPAASYVQVARNEGARIAVVNMDSRELGSAGSLRSVDFLFEGDAARVLPDILGGVVGGLEGVVGEVATVNVARNEEDEGDEEEEEEMDEVQKYFAASP
ncbi:NAD-dependent protein deacylase [Lachnellula occidentalis]|uniref:NAD-dependent protein deacylase n=1 Tax=Lachnellula occidentalis TaxID=215460 RepID=A0A8H8RLA5_9HELO|nr:NAD-dependent protein deacylase [Lachnellula occidentalis]